MILTAHETVVWNKPEIAYLEQLHGIVAKNCTAVAAEFDCSSFLHHLDDLATLQGRTIKMHFPV